MSWRVFKRPTYGEIHKLFPILPHLRCQLGLPIVQMIDTFQISELRLELRDTCGSFLEISLMEEIYPQSSHKLEIMKPRTCAI